MREELEPVFWAAMEVLERGQGSRGHSGVGSGGAVPEVDEGGDLCWEVVLDLDEAAVVAAQMPGVVRLMRVMPVQDAGHDLDREEAVVPVVEEEEAEEAAEDVLVPGWNVNPEAVMEMVQQSMSAPFFSLPRGSLALAEVAGPALVVVEEELVPEQQEGVVVVQQWAGKLL